MLHLYIANKNYSSWSLRPWVLMQQLGIAFDEHLVPFGQGPGQGGFTRFSPTGKVPCLVDGPLNADGWPAPEATVVWDSMGITEYLAERHPAVWPSDPVARAWARCAAAEMHSGFGALRDTCTMNCGVRVALHRWTPAVLADWARIAALWDEGLQRFGGPWLAGEAFTAVDAFFAPVALRVQTYAPDLPAAAIAYAARLRELPAMQAWVTDALAETWRDGPHEQELLQAGRITQDLRRTA